MTEVVGRHFTNGAWVRIGVEGDRIAAVEPSEPQANEVWVAPAFWDIQTNGRWGVSFSDAGLTVEQVSAVVRAQAELGTARLCPTLITASYEATEHGVRTIARACEEDETIGRMVAGIHLEGPYISELDGYRGAHPLEHVRDPELAEFQRWQDAAGGRVAIVTLAPERPGALEFIRRVSNACVVAIGHTAADGETIAAAVESGARLSTHLGNGLASPLPRHPNPIWVQAAEDRLIASMIADGHHLGPEVLRVLARAKGPGRTVLVSDASPLAGLPVGPYGPWAVDPGGKIVVAGTPYLAGSNQGLEIGIGQLRAAAGWGLAEAIATCAGNPARLLGFAEPKLKPGGVANLVRFRAAADGRIDLIETWVDGQRTAAGPADPPVGLAGLIAGAVPRV